MIAHTDRVLVISNNKNEDYFNKCVKISFHDLATSNSLRMDIKQPLKLGPKNCL